MTKTLHGKVHGRTIELDEDPGVADGQEVEVEVREIGLAQPATKPRRLGTLRGTVRHMASDFDAPLEEFKEYMP